MQTALQILNAFWATAAEMAPWLLLGFLAAGVLSVFFSPRFIERHLGGRGVGPVVKASILGVPLPLCSCGVIPVGAGLFRHGASRGAASSFMLSTPQTGVDSILATYALMGPVLAVVRPVVALANGVLGGWLIDAAGGSAPPPPDGRSSKEGPDACGSGDASCCGSQTQDSVPEAPCCGPNESSSIQRPKWIRALRYGLITLPTDIAGALLVGLVIAALLTALIPADALAPYLGGGVLAMVAAVLVGAPLYVCATASIPIGMGLLAAGASPGAVLAFLIAGPATNAATISVTWNVLGRRTGLLYLLSVLATAIGSGLLLDTLFTLESLDLPLVADTEHHHGLSVIDHVFAALLLVLMFVAVWNRFRPKQTATEPSQADKPTGDTTELIITGMSCSRCVEAVERELREITGVRDAGVDLKTGRARVHGDAVDPDLLTKAVTDLGFGIGS